jgi:hypothetical protein
MQNERLGLRRVFLYIGPIGTIALYVMRYGTGAQANDSGAKWHHYKQWVPQKGMRADESYNLGLLFVHNIRRFEPHWSGLHLGSFAFRCLQSYGVRSGPLHVSPIVLGRSASSDCLNLVNVISTAVVSPIHGF